MVGLSVGLVAGIAVLAALLVLALALRQLLLVARDRRRGELVGVDVGTGAGVRLAAPRLRLAGRPDELRRRRDGRFVPVEFKSRAAPAAGPPRSHRVQVGAYCLLLEETTGRAPPHGVVRYGDGAEWEVPYSAELRAEVLEILDELRAPYDGRARPSRGRCAGCAWRPGCDARAR